MYNSVQTFQGAANAIGGAIRTARLDYLSNTVHDRRKDLEAAKVKADAALKSVVDARDGGFLDYNGLVETLQNQSKVDTEMERSLLAQARLDRAQNQQAIWQAGTGVANFAQGMGVGYMPQYAAVSPQAVQVQVQGQAPQAYLPGVGGILIPAAAGFLGGVAGGALIDTRDRRRDP